MGGSKADENGRTDAAAPRNVKPSNGNRLDDAREARLWVSLLTTSRGCCCLLAKKAIIVALRNVKLISGSTTNDFDLFLDDGWSIVLLV